MNQYDPFEDFYGKLSRTYTFIKLSGESLEVIVPKSLDEYIKTESKSPVGTYRVETFSEGSRSFIRVKGEDFMWTPALEEEIPATIKLYLSVVGINLAYWL